MTDRELQKLKELGKAANALTNSIRMMGKAMNENADYFRRWSEQVELTRAKLRERLLTTLNAHLEQTYQAPIPEIIDLSG